MESISQPSKKRNHLSIEAKRHLFEKLIMMFDGKKLKHGSIKMLVQTYSVCPKTVSKIWSRAKLFIFNGDMAEFSSNYVKRASRKRIQVDAEKVKQIPLRNRKSIMDLSIALGISKSVLHRRIKEGALRRHSNAIKPQLTEENKKARLRFCLSMLEVRSLTNSSALSATFLAMYDRVVIDEKWFYMSQESEKYYLLPGENEPYRTFKSKRFIPKVMFLVVVVRPWFDMAGNVLFDGKNGIFPFIFQEPAKRNSKNRAAGTLVTKPILSITQDVIRSCLLEKVLPAIKEKWSSCSRMSTIYIQQDNARPHIDPLDDKFLAVAQGDGFDIRLTCQPPNSPDFNVLDLGYFRAIQSLQYREAPKTIDELVLDVSKSFEELSPSTLNRVFLTFQECMIEVMKSKGGNNYKIPHMKKDHLEKQGCPPVTLSCDHGLLREVVDYLES